MNQWQLGPVVSTLKSPGDSGRTNTGPSMCVCVGGSALPDEDTWAHVQSDGVGASNATGLPVGLGVAVRQLAGPVWVRGHLHLLPAPVFLHFHTGAWGRGREGAGGSQEGQR